jgi:hypothetical protein
MAPGSRHPSRDDGEGLNGYLSAIERRKESDSFGGSLSGAVSARSPSPRRKGSEPFKAGIRGRCRYLAVSLALAGARSPLRSAVRSRSSQLRRAQQSREWIGAWARYRHTVSSIVQGKIFGQVCLRLRWRWHVWCLMDNSYHVVIETIGDGWSSNRRQLKRSLANHRSALDRFPAF